MTALLTLPAAGEFEMADINYVAIAPMIVVFAAAVLGVLVEAFAPRRLRYPIQVGLAVLALVIAFAALVLPDADSVTGTTVAGTLAVDGPSRFLTGTLLVLGLVA